VAAGARAARGDVLSQEIRQVEAVGARWCAFGGSAVEWGGKGLGEMAEVAG